MRMKIRIKNLEIVMSLERKRKLMARNPLQRVLKKRKGITKTQKKARKKAKKKIRRKRKRRKKIVVSVAVVGDLNQNLQLAGSAEAEASVRIVVIERRGDNERRIEKESAIEREKGNVIGFVKGREKGTEIEIGETGTETETDTG